MYFKVLLNIESTLSSTYRFINDIFDSFRNYYKCLYFLKTIKEHLYTIISTIFYFSITTNGKLLRRKVKTIDCIDKTIENCSCLT